MVSGAAKRGGGEFRVGQGKKERFGGKRRHYKPIILLHWKK